jgi:hypothetical protein
MDALGCQVAVSLMFFSPISDKGTKSTLKHHMTQILPSNFPQDRNDNFSK